uniref:Centrosomal protein of 162 kDa n=1 Tax=Anisakis simplex TaxID=6269 RepID=A0A0M3JY70_ANISI
LTMDQTDVQFSESTPSYWPPDVHIEQQQMNEHHQPDGQYSQMVELKADISLLQQQSRMHPAESQSISADQVQSQEEQQQFQNRNDRPTSTDIDQPKRDQKEKCSSGEIQPGSPLASLLSSAYEAADAALREIDNDLVSENFGIMTSPDSPFGGECRDKLNGPGHGVERSWATEGRDEEPALPEKRAERTTENDLVERDEVQQINHSLEAVLGTDQELVFEKQHIPGPSEEQFEAKNKMIGRKFPIPTQNILEEIVYFQESVPEADTHSDHRQASTSEDVTELEELSFRPVEKLDETRIQQKCVQKNPVSISEPIFGASASENYQQINGNEKSNSDKKLENSGAGLVQEEIKNGEITEAKETDFETKVDGTSSVINENRLAEVEQIVKMQKTQQAKADIESNIATLHSEAVASCLCESAENHKVCEKIPSSDELQDSAVTDEKSPPNKPATNGKAMEISSNPKYTNGSTGLNSDEKATQQVSSVKRSRISASNKVTNGMTAKKGPSKVDGAMKKLQAPAVPPKPKTTLKNPGMEDKLISLSKRTTTNSKIVNVGPKKSEPEKRLPPQKSSISTATPKKTSSGAEPSLRAPPASRGNPVSTDSSPTKQKPEASSNRPSNKPSAPSKSVKTISATAGKSELQVENYKPKPSKATARDNPSESQASFSQKSFELTNKTVVEKHEDIAFATDSKLESDETTEPVVRHQVQEVVRARDPIVWIETLVPILETIFTYADHGKLVNGSGELLTVDEESVRNEMNQECMTEKTENFKRDEESNGRMSSDQTLIEATECIHPSEMIPTSSTPSEIIEQPELIIPPTSVSDAPENVVHNSVNDFPEEPTSSVQLIEKNIDMTETDTKNFPDFVSPFEAEPEILSDVRSPVDELPVDRSHPAELPSCLSEPSTIPDIGTSESEKPDEPKNRVSELLEPVITKTEMLDHSPVETVADLNVDHSVADTVLKELPVQTPDQIVQPDDHKNDAIQEIDPHYDANVGVTTTADYAAGKMPDEASNAHHEPTTEKISSSESNGQPRSKLQSIVISSIVPPDPDHVQQQTEQQKRREEACGNGQADESQKQSLSGTTTPQKPRQHGRGQFRGMVVDSMTSEQDDWYQSRGGERQNGNSKQKQYHSNEGGDYSSHGGTQGQSQQQQHQRKSKRRSKKSGKSHRGGYRAE